VVIGHLQVERIHGVAGGQEIEATVVIA